MRTLRSRTCRCGLKLLLKVEKNDKGFIEGWELHRAGEGYETTSVIGIIGKRSGRTIRTWSMGLAYLYCRACKARVQVRTFDTLEEYLDKK